MLDDGLYASVNIRGEHVHGDDRGLDSILGCLGSTTQEVVKLWRYSEEDGQGDEDPTEVGELLLDFGLPKGHGVIRYCSSSLEQYMDQHRQVVLKWEFLSCMKHIRTGLPVRFYRRFNYPLEKHEIFMRLNSTNETKVVETVGSASLDGRWHDAGLPFNELGVEVFPVISQEVMEVPITVRVNATNSTVAAILATKEMSDQAEWSFTDPAYQKAMDLVQQS